MHSEPYNVAAEAGRRTEEGDDPGESEGGGENKTLLLARRSFLVSSGFTGAVAPWLLGGETVASEWVLLAGAGATAVTGFWVRRLCVRTYSGRAAWKVEQVCLGCGALFLVLMLLQALNPAFRVDVVGTGARLVHLNPIPWLPQSIADAFDGGGGRLPVFRNAWRYLLIFGIGWVYVTGLAAGFRERHNARAWARVMGINGALLACISLLHAATGSRLAWWLFKGEGEAAGGAVFLEKTPEGAYLAALLTVACGLAAGEKESKKWRRAWEGVALVLWAATVMADPRIATACASVGLVIYWWTRREAMGWRSRDDLGIPRAWFLGAGVTAVVIALSFTIGTARFPDEVEVETERPTSEVVKEVQRTGGESLQAMEREVGLAMWVDRPIVGWGGGAYANLFDIYAGKVVSMAAYLHSLPAGKERPANASAESDVVEFLVDYGVVGLLLLLAIFGVHLNGWIYWRGWSNPLALFMTVGVVGTLVHASFDSILRNPAALLLFSGMQVAAVRLAAPSKGRKSGRVRRGRQRE